MIGVGIMQGRLVPPIDDLLQSFPVGRWMDEFPLAAAAGLDAIEWIYDVRGALENPIQTEVGRIRMGELSNDFGVRVLSVCADYFIERRLLLGEAVERDRNAAHLRTLLSWANKAGIRRVVLPFVDASAIDLDHGIREAVTFLGTFLEDLERTGVEIHLETSLSPRLFNELLAGLPHPFFQVNYDSGNSASLGYRPRDEFDAYGDRIGSVHIKDRILGGGSVP